MPFFLGIFLGIHGSCTMAFGAHSGVRPTRRFIPRTSTTHRTREVPPLKTENASLAANLPQLDPTPLHSPDQRIQVGDLLKFQVNLQVLEPISQSILQLRGQDPSLNLNEQGWEIRPIHVQSDSNRGEEQASNLWIFEAIPLKSGTLVLPPLFILDSDQKPLAKVTSLSLEVHSAISAQDPNPNQPAYIQPPVGFSMPIWFQILGIFLAILFLIALIYAFVLLRRKKKGRHSERMAPVQSPLEAALAALHSLQQKGDLEVGQYKVYYFKLSEILKAYLGSFYQCDALESTTHELFLLLRARNVEETQMYFLQGVFKKLDQVKFTDWVPEEADAKILLTEIQTWIENSGRNTSRETSGISDAT